MKQTIITAFPPVYERCIAQFGEVAICGRPIIWSWGSKIYNPMGIDIPHELLAHEAVHGERQGVDEYRINAWWDKYLTDTQYRYEEERVAHHAEWADYARRRPGKDNSAMLNRIAERLASPLYGSIGTVAEARLAVTSQSPAHFQRLLKTIEPVIGAS